MKWAVKLAPLHPFSDRAPMAEAIGLRPSIVGLVELSSAALQSCHDYVAKVKQVSDDVQSVISEVALLRSILEQRYRLISDRKDEKKELTLEITRSPAWSIQSMSRRPRRNSEKAVVDQGYIQYPRLSPVSTPGHRVGRPSLDTRKVQDILYPRYHRRPGQSDVEHRNDGEQRQRSAGRYENVRI
ncbi:hypothetical protein FRC19_011517 [Serendipita sp. 401]|nr:hypothetical protein FRC19_011517 [Serendipita sp. 401]KAG8862374.1 hypothetical protein FRC20_011241 [Serendipita sp. 405]